MAGVRMSVDPGGPRAGFGDEVNRALARDVEAYNDAVEAEEWIRAGSIAGNIAVRLEDRDHPDALTWWQRSHECDRRAAEAAGGVS